MTPSSLTLHADEGPLKDMALPWKDGGTVGRESGNALVLKDTNVSRRHARIFLSEGTWCVEDLGSRNGTHVNGQRVQVHLLKDGDKVRIGVSVLRCEIGETGKGGKAGERPVPDTRAEPSVTEAISKQSLDFLRQAADAPEEVARSHQRLVDLFQFARSAAEAPSLETLWEMASEAVAKALRADRVFAVRPAGPQGKAWEPHRPQASGLEARVAAVPLSRSVLDRVKERGDSVLCKAPGADERFAGSKSLADASVATVICVPVRRSREGKEGGEVLGALYADRIGDAAPFTHADLELAIAFAIALATPWAQARRVAELLAGKAAFERELSARHDLVGQSPAMTKVLEMIDRSAPAPSPVLVTGDSGVGKELVARAIHRQSPRAKGPFEVVNCAALTESLFESELFGHMRGSFTGAHEDKPGRFELADKGTLFLDEIGDLPESCQTKLLRVLEDGQVRRVGDTKDRSVDVRVVAATNRDLEGQGSRFRRDLFYRLNVFRIEVPPLRVRREDIPLLAAHYAKRFCASCQKPPKTISPEAVSVLAAHAWPGNVRELRNCLERMVVLSDRPVLDVDDIPSDIRRAGGAAAASPGGAPSGAPGPLVSMEEVEVAHIRRVLSAVDGNKKRAAEILGIDRGTLYAKLKRHGIGEPHGNG